jgi:hypothetical protein
MFILMKKVGYVHRYYCQVDISGLVENYRVAQQVSLVSLGTRFNARFLITKPGPYGPSWDIFLLGQLLQWCEPIIILCVDKQPQNGKIKFVNIQISPSVNISNKITGCKSQH